MDIQQLPKAKSVVVHADLEALSMAVAQRIADISAQAIAERGVFHLALAGGETPRRCYERLRRMPLEWAHIHIYFGDERCLPIGSADRNDSMVSETLLKHVAIPPVNIHTISAASGPDIAANNYAAVLADIVPLDLVLLGMGEDGHTASLFPANPATENKALAVPVFNAPKLPAERVSLGMSALNSARQKLFLVAGAGKRAALEQILHGVMLPASRIEGAEWHLDRAAAYS